MSGDEIKQEYDRISDAKKRYDKIYNTNRRVQKIVVSFLGAMYLLTLISFFEPLYSILTKIIGFPSYTIIFPVWAISLALIMIFWRFLAKKNAILISKLKLSIEEDLFILVYNMLNNIKLYKNENDEDRKEVMKSELVSSYVDIYNIISDWSVGNVKVIQNDIGKSVITLKNKMYRLNIDIILDNDRILNNFVNFLQHFIVFLSNNESRLLYELTDDVNQFPYIEDEIKEMMKISDLLYNQPLFWSGIITILATIIAVAYTRSISHPDPLNIILMTLFGVFAITYQVLNSKKRDIKTDSSNDGESEAHNLF